MAKDGEWVEIDPDDLNGWVEFDSPFEVRELPDYPPAQPQVRNKWELHVPSHFDDEIDASGWETWSRGYTGQDRYHGPVMHNSEYLGGRMASDLLAEPGIYVLTAATWTPIDEDNDDDEPYYVEGWVVLKKKES